MFSYWIKHWLTLSKPNLWFLRWSNGSVTLAESVLRMMWL